MQYKLLGGKEKAGVQGGDLGCVFLYYTKT